MVGFISFLVTMKKNQIQSLDFHHVEILLNFVVWFLHLPKLVVLVPNLSDFTTKFIINLDLICIHIFWNKGVHTKQPNHLVVFLGSNHYGIILDATHHSLPYKDIMIHWVNQLLSKHIISKVCVNPRPYLNLWPRRPYKNPSLKTS
jgi:hypothetical protein